MVSKLMKVKCKIANIYLIPSFKYDINDKETHYRNIKLMLHDTINSGLVKTSVVNPYPAFEPDPSLSLTFPSIFYAF